jgi:general secretion pathway protein H
MRVAGPRVQRRARGFRAHGPAPRTLPRRGVPSQGFSLLEVLLVVAILAIASVLAAAAIRGGTPGLQLRTQAKKIAAQLRHTRAHAIATGEAQRFTLDPAAHAWTAPGDRDGEIPEEMAIAFIGAREVQPRAGEGAIVFFPDGASTGGRVQLSLRSAAWNVDVAWLTGEVRVRRGEASR